MPKTKYLGRRAFALENKNLRVTLMEEGGHIAEVYHKTAGVNPLWTPNWKTGEPSEFGPQQEKIFGTGVDAKLLYGILGHNLCLDLFGPPSDHEAAAGMTAHGEASLLPYTLRQEAEHLVCSLHMPLAQLEFERRLSIREEDVTVHETVRNLAAFDRPLAWTQHVTLSPPFLDPKTTQFRVSGREAIVAPVDPGTAPYLRLGQQFAWPNAPLANGHDTLDAQGMRPEAPSSSHIAVRMNEGEAHWTAWSPESRLAFSYVWNTSDFPWLGIWEENLSRPWSPWNKQAVTRGMEFGAAPFAETRRETVDRSRVLGIPTYRWLPALGTLEATYWIRTQIAEQIPETVSAPAKYATATPQTPEADC
jgi:hypothetical protein